MPDVNYLSERAAARNGSTVYFIGCAATGAVKIGFTERSVRGRLRSIQTGSPFPLQVLARIDGDRGDEAMLHAVFAPLRLHGEWFERRGKLDDFIGYLEGGASLDAALWDCVATGMTFPETDLAALAATADCSALPQWCLDEI